MLEMFGCFICTQKRKSKRNDSDYFKMEQVKVVANNNVCFDSLLRALLCGPLGFENFMRPDWMKMVLTWQDKKDGCFKVDYMEAIMEGLKAEAEIDKTSQEKQDKTQSEDTEKRFHFCFSYL